MGCGDPSHRSGAGGGEGDSALCLQMVNKRSAKEETEVGEGGASRGPSLLPGHGCVRPDSSTPGSPFIK